MPESASVKANLRQEASNDMKECVDRVLHTDARVPVSTYRVQMHKDFTFAHAQAIAGYLKQLGIGDFYSSPIFEARPNSMHGYDVTRHDRLNPELGGAEGFDSFSAELERQGLGLLLDIVPNHMGVGNDSVWWQDVLENGHASQYSEYFDIDWKPLKEAMRNKLLLPILGDQYGAELEAKHIQVSIEDGRPLIHYYDHTMPVAPRTLPIIFDQLETNPSPCRRYANCWHSCAKFRRMKPATRVCGNSGGHSWRSCCRGCGRRCARPRCSRLPNRRWSKRSMASRAIRTVSTACTFCWTPSLTGWPPGALPRRRSTTAASST